jgi:hypothetical protein
MEKKQVLYALLGVALVAIVASAWYLFLAPSGSGRVDARKILLAAQAYTREIRANGNSVPPTVSLQVLVTRGFLKPEDISGFDGMDVTVSLTMKANDPHAELMRARLPDGHDLVVLIDGTVQSQ